MLRPPTGRFALQLLLAPKKLLFGSHKREKIHSPRPLTIKELLRILEEIHRTYLRKPGPMAVQFGATKWCDAQACAGLFVLLDDMDDALHVACYW